MPGIAICNSPILSSGAAPPAWTPADTPNTLLWMGSYDPANATLHTQPTNIDDRGTFDADADWTKGAGWTIGGGVATFNTPTTGAYLTATGTACISGCRYSAQFDVARRVVGSFRLDMGGVSGTNRLDVGTYSEECTATSTTGLRVLGAGGGTEGDIDNVRSFTNKSVTSYTPKYRAPGLTGVMASQHATAMPYPAATGLYYSGDTLNWNGALSDFKCFTDGSGATFIVCLTTQADPGATDNTIMVVGTTDSNYACLMLYYKSTTVRIKVGNGSGIYDLDASAAATFVTGTTYVITLRIASGVNGVTIRQNKVNKLTASLTAPSADDPIAPFRVGEANPARIIHDYYVANRVLTDDEVEAIENDMYFRATGGTL